MTPSNFPAAVKRIIANRTTKLVWYNDAGAITLALPAENPTEYLTCGMLHREFSPSVAAERTQWVGQYLPVAQILEAADDGTTGWLHSKALPGTCAIEWPAKLAVPALGRALRIVHDTLPVAGCPWTWEVELRLADCGEPARKLGAAPTPERLVVCHGDACNPNFLLESVENGLSCSGYLDLQRVGVADRWADIAAACCSLKLNFGENWDEVFLDAYGVQLDVRLQWYQQLWQLE